MARRKTQLAIAPKVRSIQDINQEYNAQCVQIGHKMRLISDLEREVQAHFTQLHTLTQEAAALPKQEGVKT